jgi:hypothetical protein
MGLAFVLGAAVWLGLSAFAAEGGTPLDSGMRLLVVLAIAGGVIGLLHGDLDIDVFTALFAGEVAGMVVHTVSSDGPGQIPLIPLRALFLLSYDLSAVAGAALGVVLRSTPTPPRPDAP